MPRILAEGGVAGHAAEAKDAALKGALASAAPPLPLTSGHYEEARAALAR